MAGAIRAPPASQSLPHPAFPGCSSTAQVTSRQPKPAAGDTTTLQGAAAEIEVTAENEAARAAKTHLREPLSQPKICPATHTSQELLRCRPAQPHREDLGTLELKLTLLPTDCPPPAELVLTANLKSRETKPPRAVPALSAAFLGTSLPLSQFPRPTGSRCFVKFRNLRFSTAAESPWCDPVRGSCGHTRLLLCSQS